MILLKRLIAAIFATCMLAVLVTAVPTASADNPEEETGVLVCHMTMSYNPPEWNYWLGTISGPIKGRISFVELPMTIDNGLEYFHESFLIETSKGTLSGEDRGVYNLTTGDFWAYGTVMDATGRWSGLVGYTMFEWGVTTEPFVIPMVAADIPVVLVPPEPVAAHAHDVVVTYNEFSFDTYWHLDTSGDIQGTGAIYLDTEKSYLYQGNEYFFEDSVFTTRQGILQGSDRGFFDLTTGNFWAVGQVTDASGRWNFLEGYAYISSGTISLETMSGAAPFIFVEV